MDAETTTKAMIAVLECKKIGTAAAIIAAMQIAERFVRECEKDAERAFISQAIKAMKEEVQSNEKST